MTVIIDIDIDDADIKDRLRRLQKAGRSLRPAFQSIGEELLISTRARFRAMQDPEGRPWKPLSPRYKARKKKNKDRILILNGHLVGTLAYQARATELLFGTPRIYGAVHQFGARKGQFGKDKRGRPIPWGDIPARPFLGISKGDKAVILSILERHLRR